METVCAGGRKLYAKRRAEFEKCFQRVAGKMGREGVEKSAGWQVSRLASQFGRLFGVGGAEMAMARSRQLEKHSVATNSDRLHNQRGCPIQLNP
jgi:hypothetical protein